MPANTSALVSALARAALDAGWALEVSEPGTDAKGPLLVVGFRPNPSPYGEASSVARAKGRVALVSAAVMEQYGRSRQEAIERGLLMPDPAEQIESGILEGEADPD